MELKTFIANTLIEIAEGVNEAKPEYAKLGGRINPEQSGPITRGAKKVCDVQFEIALSDASSNSSGKGIGVLLSIVSVNGNKTENQENTSLSRITFVVPVELP